MPPQKRSSSAHEGEDMEYTVKKAKTTNSKPKKTAKGAGTCSLTKKEIGDRVKESLALQKYHIPQTHFKMDMDMPFFRSFFVDNSSLTRPLAIVPAIFDENTPVVVIEMGNMSAGELLGVSKVKGCNRMVETQLAAMSVIFRPKEEKGSIWLTV